MFFLYFFLFFSITWIYFSLSLSLVVSVPPIVSLCCHLHPSLHFCLLNFKGYRRYPPPTNKHPLMSCVIRAYIRTFVGVCFCVTTAARSTAIWKVIGHEKVCWVIHSFRRLSSLLVVSHWFWIKVSDPFCSSSYPIYFICGRLQDN